MNPPTGGSQAGPEAGSSTSSPAMNGGRLARWAALGVILGAVVLTAAFAGRFGIDPSVVATPLIGKPAPEVTLPFLERPGSLALADLRGEIVLVNFWASWCLACRAEHDDLVAAADAYREAGVRFVGIAYLDRPQDAIRYLDEMGRGRFDYVLDPGSRAAIEFGVFGVPETFFIDRQGTIVAKITGESNFLLLSQTLDQIILGRKPESRTTGTVQPAPGG